MPSPNRYMTVASFCFCKNNKRTIIFIRHLQDDGLGGSDEEGCLGPAPGQHVQLEGSESEGCVDEWGKYDISEQYVDQEQTQRRLLQGMGVPVGTLFYPDLNPKLNPPYISTIIETLNSKTILSLALALRPVCLAPRPCLGTKPGRV